MDLAECLCQFVRAWPIQIKLLDCLSIDAECFDPEVEALASLQLVYLPGCGDLELPLTECVILWQNCAGPL